jgi:hypothetical protein
MLRIILPFLLSCNNELLFCLNTAYGKRFDGKVLRRICEKSEAVFLLSLHIWLCPPPSARTAKSDVLDRPFFGDNARNVTALTNGTVTLKCTVKNKANRTVSKTFATHTRV